MNTFNRFLGIVVAVALMAVGLGLFLVAAGVVTPGQLGPFGNAAYLFDTAGRRGAVELGAALVFLAGLLLLIAEVGLWGRRSRRVLVKHDEMGRVSMDLDGIEELVVREAKRIGGVLGIRSRVDEDKDGLQIVEWVSVAPDASVPDLSRELQERTKNVVERYVGRPVHEVRVDARLAPAEKRRGSA